jgi:hypothetical protein
MPRSATNGAADGRRAVSKGRRGVYPGKVSLDGERDPPGIMRSNLVDWSYGAILHRTTTELIRRDQPREIVYKGVGQESVD